MPYISDHWLARYLAGALDPGDAQDMQALLAVDAGLRQRAAALDAAAPGLPTPWWHLPSSNLAASSVAVATMSASASASLTFEPPEGTDAYVVVLLEQADAWVVTAPNRAEEVLRVGELPREPDGRVSVDVAANQFALLLVPPDAAPDWSAEEPWATAVAAVAAGRGFVFRR